MTRPARRPSRKKKRPAWTPPKGYGGDPNPHPDSRTYRDNTHRYTTRISQPEAAR